MNVKSPHSRHCRLQFKVLRSIALFLPLFQFQRNVLVLEVLRPIQTGGKSPRKKAKKSMPKNGTCCCECKLWAIVTPALQFPCSFRDAASLAELIHLVPGSFSVCLGSVCCCRARRESLIPSAEAINRNTNNASVLCTTNLFFLLWFLWKFLSLCSDASF